ncbi:MAG: hypothetical protein PHC50_01465 [Candidatus Cloacimonetes bacterium]|nr:hypothetical protein [Candidatus Cloacimonadota bacterium]
MSAKKVLGQYFTKKDLWLKPQVEAFIVNSKCSIAYDPFAGNGDMLETIKGIGEIKQTVGLDIDPKLSWRLNDSLQAIPALENAIIITNPPYLAKYSAKRKQIHHELEYYYQKSGFVDIYQLALFNTLQSAKYVVAIIPETFVNSRFSYMNRLSQITVLEENPFEDTENPVCVVCFDGKIKNYDQIKIYKNDKYICTLDDLERHRLKPRFSARITFNTPEGKIALRGVDSTNTQNPISFMREDELDYDTKLVKASSRLITLIDIDSRYQPYVDDIIQESNQILKNYRNITKDLLLSPFKGNQKNGVRRRRRLDYKSARAILEMAIDRVNGNNDSCSNLVSNSGWFGVSV